MALTLAELRQAMGAYTAAFDAGLVAPGQLRGLADAGAIEGMASTVSALIGARLARGALGHKPGLAGRAARPGPRRGRWPRPPGPRSATPAGP